MLLCIKLRYEPELFALIFNRKAGSRSAVTDNIASLARKIIWDFNLINDQIWEAFESKFKLVEGLKEGWPSIRMIANGRDAMSGWYAAFNECIFYNASQNALLVRIAILIKSLYFRNFLSILLLRMIIIAERQESNNPAEIKISTGYSFKSGPVPVCP